MRRCVLCLLTLTCCTVNQTLRLDPEEVLQYCVEHPEVEECALLQPPPAPAADAKEPALADQPSAYFVRVQLNATVLQEGAFRSDPVVEGEEQMNAEPTPSAPWISGHVAKNGRAMHAAPEAMLSRAVTLEAMEGSHLQGSFVIQDMCAETEEGEGAACLGTLIGTFSCVPAVHLP